MSTDPAREVAIRIEAQEDLYFFSRYMFKERRKYKWMHNWHHRVVCDALMRVFRGETKRLIINVPPRYSKTELAVINFMAWCFGKVPDCEFIHISYSATLAANNAFQTRNLVQETAFKQLRQFSAGTQPPAGQQQQQIPSHLTHLFSHQATGGQGGQGQGGNQGAGDKHKFTAGAQAFAEQKGK